MNEQRKSKSFVKLFGLLILAAVSLVVIRLIYVSEPVMDYRINSATKKECVAIIKQGLNAPSTFKLIQFTPAGIVEIEFVEGLTNYPPIIEFDADNAMGVPIRHKVACKGDRVVKID